MISNALLAAYLLLRVRPDDGTRSTSAESGDECMTDILLLRYIHASLASHLYSVVDSNFKMAVTFTVGMTYFHRHAALQRDSVDICPTTNQSAQ